MRMPLARRGESGYAFFSLSLSRPVRNSLFVIFLAALVIGGSYLFYLRSSTDHSPDSIAGYIYAIVGIFFFVLAGCKYSMTRRSSRQRSVGKLNSSLNWHVALGVITLMLLFAHSFGNFNPRSGTFALYGMIALVISGFIGRTLDRIMPRLIAAEVDKVLTAQGDDRIASISQHLQNIAIHNTAGLSDLPQVNSLPGLPPPVQSNQRGKQSTLSASWDLAYLSQEEMPHELSHQSMQYAFGSGQRRPQPAFNRMGTQEQMVALMGIEKAMQREQFYRYVIRYWRYMHIFLLLVTIGCTIWHLIYAAELIIPTYLH